jgi:hypothetical protein
MVQSRRRDMPDRPQKITLAEMRDMGVRGLLVYCSEYKCRHLITTRSMARRHAVVRSRTAVHLLSLRQARRRRAAGLQRE